MTETILKPAQPQQPGVSKEFEFELGSTLAMTVTATYDGMELTHQTRSIDGETQLIATRSLLTAILVKLAPMLSGFLSSKQVARELLRFAFTHFRGVMRGQGGLDRGILPPAQADAENLREFMHWFVVHPRKNHGKDCLPVCVPMHVCMLCMCT